MAYAATKAIRSGSKSDFLKMRTIRDIEGRIRSLRAAALNDDSQDKKIAEIITTIQILVANYRLTQEKGTEILAAVEAKQLSVTEAFDLLQALLLENERLRK